MHSDRPSLVSRYRLAVAPILILRPRRSGQLRSQSDGASLDLVAIPAPTRADVIRKFLPLTGGPATTVTKPSSKQGPTAPPCRTPSVTSSAPGSNFTHVSGLRHLSLQISNDVATVAFLVAVAVIFIGLIVIRSRWRLSFHLIALARRHAHARRRSASSPMLSRRSPARPARRRHRPAGVRAPSCRQACPRRGHVCIVD